jgi:secretion/DNA translocation related TadE-like protein
VTGAGPCRRDRGSGTIYALVVAAVVATVALAAAAVGGAVIARHRAMSAADLAALAGADVLAAGGGDPCGAAAHIAARHQVDLLSCSTAGLVVDVTVGVAVRGALGFGLMAEMRSRAGPGGEEDRAGLPSPGPPG